MCTPLVLNVEEHQKCFLKTRAVCNSCSKANIESTSSRSKNVLAHGNRHDMCIFSVLNVEGHQKCFLKKECVGRNRQWYMCILFVLNVEKHQKYSLKTRAVRNSCSKGNIDRSKNVLAEIDMIHVYILCSKCRRNNNRNAFSKRVRFVFLITPAVRNSCSKGNISTILYFTIAHNALCLPPNFA